MILPQPLLSRVNIQDLSLCMGLTPSYSQLEVWLCLSHVTFKSISHLHRLLALVMSEAEHRMLSKIKKAPEFPFSVILILHRELLRDTLKREENFKSVPALVTVTT